MTLATPTVSVVLSAYNSDSTIALCLDSLRRQTFQDFEVIVVNSSAEDRTRSLVETDYPEVVFKQSPQRLLPHAARNAGVESARGRILVFSDPDCVAHTDWLEKLMAAGDGDTRIVQGAMGLYGSSWLARGIHLCKWHALLPGLPAHSLWLVATGNALYPRELFDSVAPFEGDLFCGDALLSWRAVENGAELWFDPAAVVEQIHDGGLGSLCWERWRRGLEFGELRMAREDWTLGKTLLMLACLPALVGLVLVRTFLASLRTGWLGRFIVTLPVHLAGSAAWVLGEAWAQLRRILGVGPSLEVLKAVRRL